MSSQLALGYSRNYLLQEEEEEEEAAAAAAADVNIPDTTEQS
jgi:hypothetical protein